jgi:hypothetical protein
VRIPWRRDTGRFQGLAVGLALACPLILAGCGNPGKGTVRVSPKARARLSSPFGPKAKDSKGRPIGGKPAGFKKDRVSASSPKP